MFPTPPEKNKNRKVEFPESPQKRLRLAAGHVPRRELARRESQPPRLMGQQRWTAVRSCPSST
eukprot:6245316-Prorocentrum_lima.AAC.1